LLGAVYLSKLGKQPLALAQQRRALKIQIVLVQMLTSNIPE